MVHGGGHHGGGGGGSGGHQHHGGGSGGHHGWMHRSGNRAFGGSNHYRHHRHERNQNTNVVIVNNSRTTASPPVGWQSGGYYQSVVPIYSNDARDATSGSRFSRRDVDVRNQEIRSNNPNSSARDGNCSRCSACLASKGIVLFITLAILLILIHTSGPNKEDWVLNPGAYRQVYFHKYLTKCIETEYHSPNPRNVVSMYYFHHGCPPLTGPVVEWNESSHLFLATGDYEYDYFYLNSGSRIKVTLKADSGGANLMLFRSKSAFNEWVDDPDEETYMMKTYVSPSHHKRELSFVVDEANEYYAVYDNAMNQRLVGTATVEIKATTYDLTQKNPTRAQKCSYDSKDCRVPVKIEENNACVLVGTSSSTDRNDDGSGISVTVIRLTRLSFILPISAVPIILYCLIKIIRCIQSPKKQKPLAETQADVVYDETVPLMEAYPVGPINVVYDETVPLVEAYPVGPINAESVTYPIPSETLPEPSAPPLPEE